MTDEIRADVNGIELLFWGGHEFSQGSPLVYELAVNGHAMGGEHFDPHPVAYRDSFVVDGGRTDSFSTASQSIGSTRNAAKRVSRVRQFLSVRSVGEGYVEAATKAYDDGDVQHIRIAV